MPDKYDFRVLIKTVKGREFSYMTSSFFNSDVDTNYAVSASEVYNRITGSDSCSYHDSYTVDTTAGGFFKTLQTFKDNNFLSASLNGGEESGSISFIYTGVKVQSDKTKDRLAKFKFFGSKVCDVLNLTENFWYRPSNFILDSGSNANYFSGDVDAPNLNVTNNFKIAGGGSLSSDLPIIINKETSRWLTFLNVSGSDSNQIPHADFKIGYDDTTNTYMISASARENDSTKFVIDGVTSLNVTHLTSSYVTSSVKQQFTEITSSGNSLFGNNKADYHDFMGNVSIRGNTGSLVGPISHSVDGLTILGNISASDSLFLDGDITASFISASNAVVADRFFSSGSNGAKVPHLRLGRAEFGGSVNIGSISHYANTNSAINFYVPADKIHVTSSQFVVESNLITCGSIFVSGSGSHITSSGNISSSGTVYGNVSQVNNLVVNEPQGSGGIVTFFGTGGNVVTTVNTAAGFIIGGTTSLHSAASHNNLSVHGNIAVTGPVTASGNISASGGNFTGNFPDTDDDALHYPLVVDATNATIESQDSLKVNPSTGEVRVPSIGSGVGQFEHIFFGNDIIQVGATGLGAGKFRVDGHSSEGALFVTSSQKVGINTSTPTKALTVTGDISASGAINTLSHITASGNISASGTGIFNKLEIHGADGTLAADYIIHKGDDNTKFGFPQADKFKIQTDGTNRYVVDTTHQFTGNTFTDGTISASGDLVVGNLSTKPYISASQGNIEMSGSGTGRLEVTGSIFVSNSGSFSYITASHIDTDSDSLSIGGESLNKTLVQNIKRQFSPSALSPSGRAQATDDLYIEGVVSSSAAIHTKSHITASGNISSSGTIQSTGNISSEGTIFGKQYFPTWHQYNDTTADEENFIPAPGGYIVEGTSINYYRKWLAPYNGKLIKLVIYTGSAAGNTVIKFYVNGSVVGTTAATNVARFTATTFTDFSESSGVTTFSAGDRLSISVHPTNSPTDVNITCVWEYDIFT